MRNSLRGSLPALAAVLLSACPGPGGGPRPGNPDLVVTELRAVGPATVNSQNSVEVPVRVVVRNRGGAAAGPFKVSTHYRDPGTTEVFAVAFNVPGGTDLWYPRTTAPLAPGAEVAFDGMVVFVPAVHGVTVPLHAIADSCRGDEFMPEFCRVNESNEGNNRSPADLTLMLP